MEKALVWAFRPVAELDGATGFVSCEAKLAKRLISQGVAQDPRVGALSLRQVESGKATRAAAPPPAVESDGSKDYQTRELRAKKSRGQ
jgi:hypothetical protein